MTRMEMSKAEAIKKYQLAPDFKGEPVVYDMGEFNKCPLSHMEKVKEESKARGNDPVVSVYDDRVIIRRYGERVPF